MLVEKKRAIAPLKKNDWRQALVLLPSSLWYRMPLEDLSAMKRRLLLVCTSLLIASQALGGDTAKRPRVRDELREIRYAIEDAARHAATDREFDRMIDEWERKRQARIRELSK